MEKLPDELSRAYGLIGCYMAEEGQGPAGPPYAAFYNRDVQDLDVEIGVPVPEPLPRRGDIQSGMIPEGQYASCLYIGPHEGIGSAYDAVNEFIEAQDEAPLGVVYEFYVSDPSRTPPDERETLVVFPLEQKGEGS